MNIEYKELPDHYDFYIDNEITEELFRTLRTEVHNKVNEINETNKNNEKFKQYFDIVEDCKKQHKAINFNFFLTSFGGSIYCMFAIYDLIHELDENDNNITVNIICSGYVMSAGIVILLSSKNRFCTPNTTFMIHDLSSCYWGKLKGIEEDVEQAKKLREQYFRIVSENTQFTKEEIQRWLDCKKDYYLTSEKALEKGLIKKIIK